MGVSIHFSQNCLNLFYMLNAVLTLISVHFLIFAQNNLPCRITRRANRQIYAGDVLPAYLLSAKYIPVLLPDVPVIFPGLFLHNIAVFTLLFQTILTFSL